MYRMYGQKIAPAFSALPPSLAVVYRGCRAGIAPALLYHLRPCRRAFSAFPPSLAVKVNVLIRGDLRDKRPSIALRIISETG